jgi:hypothetical protein
MNRADAVCQALCDARSHNMQNKTRRYCFKIKNENIKQRMRENNRYAQTLIVVNIVVDVFENLVSKFWFSWFF